MKVFPADQLKAQALLALRAFSNNWAIALIPFGAHLGVLGYLA